MDLIDELRAFVATAQTGSFTGAAAQLGMSNRLTSKYVAELEAQLGVRLFQRTTRRVGLTQAGEDLLARAPALLDEIDDMMGALKDSGRTLTGALRVSAPVTFGELYVAQMLGRFGALHPDLAIDLRLSDRFVDLAAEGIDLAFRIGQSDMLSLKSRRLGTLYNVIAASPDYLAKHGHPARLEELSEHACIVDTNRRNPRQWSFTRPGGRQSVAVNGRFQVNSARAASDLAICGHGIIYVPRFAVTEAIGAGQLVTLFDGEDGDGLRENIPINAVYLEGRTVPRKLRALIDFALEDIKAARIA